jgi:hypothetical protein
MASKDIVGIELTNMVHEQYVNAALIDNSVMISLH